MSTVSPPDTRRPVGLSEHFRDSPPDTSFRVFTHVLRATQTLRVNGIRLCDRVRVGNSQTILKSRKNNEETASGEGGHKRVSTLTNTPD